MLFFSMLFLFSSILVIHVISASALGSTDTVGVEPENGTLAGPVTIGTDATASNGQYVVFGTPVTPTPVQLAISNLTVFDTANASKYSLQKNMQIGNILYGDRTYTIATLSASLAGSLWVRTANNSKTWNAGAILMSFTINNPATVSVAVDKRLPKPTWMDATWTLTNLKLSDYEGHYMSFAVFQKTYQSGTVSLGPNGGVTKSDMYTVIVQ